MATNVNLSNSVNQNSLKREFYDKISFNIQRLYFSHNSHICEDMNIGLCKFL